MDEKGERKLTIHTGRGGYVMFEMALYSQVFPNATAEELATKERKLNEAIDKFIAEHYDKKN